MQDKPIYDLGKMPPGPPSTRRVDLFGWIAMSVVCGAALGALALWVVWRPLPGLPAPSDPWTVHVAHWAKLAARIALPSWYSADAAIYSKFWATANSSERWAILWRGVVGALFALCPAIAMRGLLRPRDGLIYLRGSRRFEGAAALRELRTRLSARCAKRPDHDIAPGVPYPGDLWTRHVLMVGGVGSGKSTALKPLIDRVVSSGEQLLLFDPKSEFTIGWKRPAIIAPWDSRGLAWDVAKDMRNTLDMRRFAAALVRESQDPMWSNASRQLLVGLMVHLKRTQGVSWGWRELARLVALPQSELLPIMRECHPEAVRAVEKASVTTAGILINLSSFCASIFDLARAWGDAPPERRVSFVDWTQGRSPHRQIILQGHGAYAELTKSYVEGIVGIFSAIVNSVEMRDDPKRKIWFIFDEFGQIKAPVRALFEVGRSRGVRCVVACQDFAQLEEIYGAPMVKAVVAMSGTLLVGQMMQGETAEALCKAFGGREVERANLSSSYQGGGSNQSTTLSYSRDDVPLYKPSELSSRLGLTPDGKGVKMILFTGGDAYELVWPHFDMREERPGHCPAPWTLGAGFESSEDEGEAALEQAIDRRMALEAAKAEEAPPAAPGAVEQIVAARADAELSLANEADDTAELMEAVGEVESSPFIHFAMLLEATVDRSRGPREEIALTQRPPQGVA